MNNPRNRFDPAPINNSHDAGIGLYVHIPFCHFLCHYCDFAKTANHDSALVQQYFDALKRQFDLLVYWLERRSGTSPVFSSVFFGGGTPGLFGAEYGALMEAIYPYLQSGAEISLECNPANVTRERLSIWKSLGFNRISIGVQTFDDHGLTALTRDHDSVTALRAIEHAGAVVSSVNVDLIYGWAGQTRESWARDLRYLISSGVPHVSLYSLTYESRTPFGRMVSRGRIVPASDESLVDRYTLAMELLAGVGFIHDEVSNWTMPGYTCRHNWQYWNFGHFAAIGAGAHGFLPSIVDRAGEPDPGFRYAFPRDVRTFLRKVNGPEGLFDKRLAQSIDHHELADFFGLLGVDWVEIPGRDRNMETALTEYIGGTLRTRKGVDLTFAESLSDCGQPLRFSPRPAIAAALESGMAQITVDGQHQKLIFDPQEWFRETSWGVEVLMSLKKMV